ncbi:hypothetical protein V5P93_006713 [Actinokineospora auranticolor]|uniref:Uncharacterized protein n=1 Tax=Actinokineospora auranticolor TaxID=155976 RepID=A0A2S6GWP7_9PSEU|nr:hypothetical protein [Actinokineospora auranticolor]PPK69644.1 hypothetical protein CLV40_103254 [Actinokineospora auranticolor]
MIGAGLLLGSALLVPGRALLDAQFAVDATAVSRPELMVPTSLAPLTPALGLWALLAGHLLAAAAGVLAVGRAGAVPGSPYDAEFDASPDDRSQRTRGTALLVALVTGAAAAIGLLLAPFSSAEAFLPADDVFTASGFLRYGLLALAVATGVAAAAGAGSTRPAVARGVLLGATLGVLAVTAPQIVAGLVVPRLSLAPGPLLALLAMTVLTVVVWVSNRPETDEADAEVSLESGGLHRAAGVLGLLAGVAALVAAFAANLVYTETGDRFGTYGNRLFIPCGLLVLALAAPLLFRRAADGVRPAFTVVLAAVPLVAASTLDDAFTATAATGAVRVGTGVWFAGLSVLLAAAAAVAAGLAGAAERDDVDVSEREINLALVGPLAAAGLFAIGAFGLPAVKAPGLVPPGIWTEFRLASWGLLLAALAVVAAVALAALSRPGRAGALLLGAAGLVGVRVLEFPLTSGRVDGATPGQAMWVALACVAALVVATMVAVGRARA